MAERKIRFTDPADRHNKTQGAPSFRTLHINFFPVSVTTDGDTTTRPWEHGDPEIGEVILTDQPEISR